MNKQQREVWQRLTLPTYEYTTIENNADLLDAIIYSKQTGRVVKPLGIFMIELAQRLIQGKMYNHLTYKEDLIQEAVRQMLTSFTMFDESRSNNPIAYLTQTCNAAACRYIQHKKKQQQIKEELNV